MNIEFNKNKLRLIEDKLTIYTEIQSWLSQSVSKSSDGRYRHSLLSENLQKRGEAITALQQIVYDAHEDSRKRLRDVLGDSLDPLRTASPYPVDQYPQCLHPLTLKGYFGEIFAGIVAEHFSPHGEDGWEVPMYLFRNHDEVFRQLEALRQFGTPPGIMIGRRGDDCLAFKRDNSGKITHALVCEAKCTNSHSSTQIKEAHEKISERYVTPADTMQLIEIFLSYSDSESKAWIDALRELILDPSTVNHERLDLVSYVCGQKPTRNKTWMHPPTERHVAYTGNRTLETVEIHLHDVDLLITKVYQ